MEFFYCSLFILMGDFLQKGEYIVILCKKFKILFMNFYHHKKIITIGGISLVIVLVIGTLYFFKPWGVFTQTNTVMPNTQSKVIENVLYKRIDFINTLINEFQLNEKQEMFYKDGEKYKKIQLTHMISMDMDELQSLKKILEKYGLYTKNPNGDYVRIKLPEKNTIPLTQK